MQSSAGFGHLHQRIYTFLHPRTTGSSHTNERAAIGYRTAHALYETFADHRSHRTADKTELKRCHNHRQSVHHPLHHHQRIIFTRGFAGGGQSVGIFLTVFEFQRVGGFDVGADFLATAFV